MLDRVNEEKLEKIITVGFSNNGVAVYQHLSQLVLRGQGPGGLEVIGSVFDSGPGQPMGHMSRLVRDSPASRTDPPAKLSLVTAYVGVNIANNLSISDTVKLSFQQIQERNETKLNCIKF